LYTNREYLLPHDIVSKELWSVELKIPLFSTKINENNTVFTSISPNEKSFAIATSEKVFVYPLLEKLWIGKPKKKLE